MSKTKKKRSKENIYYLLRQIAVELKDSKNKEKLEHVASIIDRLECENTLLFKRINELDDRVHDVLDSRENGNSEIQKTSR